MNISFTISDTMRSTPHSGYSEEYVGVFWKTSDRSAYCKILPPIPEIPQFGDIYLNLMSLEDLFF